MSTPAPAPVLTPQPSSGAAAWALGLLALFMLPFFFAVAACIGMLIAAGVLRRRGGLARVNATYAANWALTYLLLTILLCGGQVALLVVFTGGAPVHDFFPLGIPITLWFAISIMHVVLSIVGTVKATGGRAFRAPAIPFLRA